MTRRLTHLPLGTLVAITLVVGVSVPAAATGQPSPTSPAAGSPAPKPPTTGSAVGGRLLASPGIVVSPGPGTPRLPVIGARAFLVADLDTGEVLAAKAAHRRLRPASTLKVLTALAVLPHVDRRDIYVARDGDAAVEGSKVGLYPGGRYSVEQLFRSMVIASGNDSAHALANAGGGVPRTVRRMNAVADRLQAKDTTAVNPTGLDAPRQFSSAYDLALIGRAGMQNRYIRGYATMIRTRLPDRVRQRGKGGAAQRAATRPTYEVWTINRLLLNYRGAIGLKTGYTTQAGGTYIGVARRGGHTLLVSVLHSRGESWEASAALLNWGFRAVGRSAPVGRLVEPVSSTPAPSVAPTTSPGTTVDEKQHAKPATNEGQAGSSALPLWPLALLLGLAVPLGLLRARARRLQQRRRRQSRSWLAADRRGDQF